MTSRTRLTIIVVALVGLAAAFVSLRPSDDDPAPATESAATSTAPAETSATTTGEETATPPPTTAAAPPKPKSPFIRTRGGKLVGKVRTLKFESGDDVVFRVLSDITEEIHVHGYDKYVDLKPGKTATVRIENAKLEGVFEVELHGTAEEIVRLEVSPS
jgi:hypothetical protein